jgi:hypothetical protein
LGIIKKALKESLRGAKAPLFYSSPSLHKGRGIKGVGYQIIKSKGVR